MKTVPWLRTLALSGVAASVPQFVHAGHAGIAATGTVVIAGVLGSFLTNRANSQRDAQTDAEERQALTSRNHYLRRGMAAALRRGLDEARLNIYPNPPDLYASLFANWDTLLRSAEENNDALDHLFPVQFVELHWEATNPYGPNQDEDAQALANLLREWLTPDASLYGEWNKEQALDLARQALPYYQQEFANDLAGDSNGLLIRAFTVKGINQIRKLVQEGIEENRELHAKTQGMLEKLITQPPRAATPFFAPSRPDYFVGREANLEILRERLRPHGSVVPVAGMPGLGKTSLAIEFAHKHADDFEGVYWINCAGLSLLAAATTLASQMGIKQEGPPEGLLPEIRRRCGERHYLLVLDGVETNDFRELIPGGRTAVPITTRQTDLPFLTKYRGPDLKVFTTEDCLNLFGEYLNAPKVALREADYRTLAESLGWLPLGVAVAAGLLKNDVRYTLDRLLHETKLHRLAHGELDISQLLGSAILSAPEAARQFLAAMAVCAPSGFRLALAAEVAGMEETSALDGLQDLRGRSLVEEIDRDKRRYRLHSLVRASAGQNAAFEKRHAEAVAGRFKSWEQRWRECAEDLPDWRLALDWAGSGPGADRIGVLTRLASGFFFFYRRGLLADGLRAMQVAEAAYEESGDRANLQASYMNQALILRAWGKPVEALALLQRQGAICEELGNRVGVALCYGSQAVILKDWGKLKEAMVLHKREEAICEELGDLAGLQRSYGNQALILQDWGKLEAAMALHKSKEAICEKLRDRAGLLASYGNQAGILRSWGKLGEAMAMLHRVEAICEELGDRAGLQATYGNQALILQDWGKLEEAMALHKREEAIGDELGDRAGLGRCYGNQALILRDWGKLDEAMALHQQEEAIWEELGNHGGLQRSYGNQALILQAWNKPEEAMGLLQRKEAICRDLGLRDDLRTSLQNKALVLDQMGQPEKAAPLRAEAAAIQADLTRGSGASA